MLIRLLLLFEILAIFICLYGLYGGAKPEDKGLNRFMKLDIYTVTFISLDILIVYGINIYHLNHNWTLVMYPIIALYCCLEYGFKLKPLIVNNILYIVILSGVQFFVYNLLGIAIQCLGVAMPSDIHASFLINAITLLITLVGVQFAHLDRLSGYLQKKEILIMISLFCSSCVVLYCLLYYKNLHAFNSLETFLLLTCIILICILASGWEKYKARARESEEKLRMHELYDESFSNLIYQIRMKQHDFENHINAVYSQHFICKTYDELVLEQQRYCDKMLQSNKYNKLLSAGNSVIIGFLYGKFLEMEQRGIEISYMVQDYKKCRENQVFDIPDYVAVELLGNLLDNAADAVLAGTLPPKIHVSILRKRAGFRMEVSNRSQRIPYEQIQQFFVQGKSSKGKGRGLGLFHVKELCAQYKIALSCTNEEIESENWITFAMEQTSN